MHAPCSLARVPAARRSRALLLALAAALLAAACGGSSGGGGQSGIPGEELEKPDGSLFFVDPNQSGGASRLHIAEISYGRLVDVHEIDASGETVAAPVFQDFLIEETIQTDASYRLERNPITQRTRLVIQARKTGVPDSSAFDQLLEATQDALPVITPKDDDSSSAPPFSLIPRNACLSVRFDDCLDDDAAAAADLADTVRLLTDYPPQTPFAARVVFDPNHGALLGANFHTTRVLVDLTVSEEEAASLPVPQPVNGLGLPPSLTTTAAANVSLRIPTEIDAASGQFAVLTNLSGVALTFDENGPVDELSATGDVVRALRSGNLNDPNNGFLLDEERPQVVGGWEIDLTAVSADPQGSPDRDFLVDITFTTVCQSAPQEDDVLTVGDVFLVVVEDGAVPDPGGEVLGVRVRSSEPVDNPLTLIGSGLFLSTFDPLLAISSACWVSFTPPPSAFPSGGVSTSSQVFVRFSEPMDPATLSAFGEFLIVNGLSTPGVSTATTSNVVVGEVIPSNDLDTFGFSPLNPLPHVEGLADALHIELQGPTDLAGNPLQNELPFVDFTLDPLDPTQQNAAVVLRFESTDEVGPDNRPDLRGQFFLDTTRGVVLPRPVSVSGWPADRTILVPAFMTPISSGVFTPLTPLGAKLQAVWRYCDVGWDVTDETKYNLDILGLNWSPIGGQVIADFFEAFEIQLGHSRFLPDERPNGTTFLPDFPSSGLQGSPNLFADNYLADPAGQPRVVHNRALGYTINPASLFLSTTQTPMIPYPLNRGPGLDQTYTWRDTAVLARGGPNGLGIPTGIEVLVGQTLLGAGTVAGPGVVPSLGLPLLIETRCFPSNSGIGLNLLDVSIANAFSPTPNFRAYSSGGIDTAGREVLKNPDLELVPSGGFNPSSTPPGQRTRLDADNVFYIGQLDVIVRVSRVHTIWLDTGVISPGYMEPVLEPSADEQPSGTGVVLDFRGASGFSSDTMGAQFDGARINAYGEITQGSVVFLNGVSTWSNDIRAVDGGRYVQVRMSFLNNIQSGLSAELSGMAIPFVSN